MNGNLVKIVGGILSALIVSGVLASVVTYSKVNTLVQLVEAHLALPYHLTAGEMVTKNTTNIEFLQRELDRLQRQKGVTLGTAVQEEEE